MELGFVKALRMIGAQTIYIGPTAFMTGSKLQALMVEIEWFLLTEACTRHVGSLSLRSIGKIFFFSPLHEVV